MDEDVAARPPPFAVAPGIAWFALGAATLEYVTLRVLWPSMHGSIERSNIASFRLPRYLIADLSTTAAFIAMIVCLFTILRAKSLVPIVARFAIAAFGGLFVAFIAVAVTEGSEHRAMLAVLFGAASSYMLGSLLCLVGVRHRGAEGSAGLRIALGLLLLLSFFSFGALVVDAPAIFGANAGNGLGERVRMLAQPLFLGAPIAAFFTFVPPHPAEALRDANENRASTVARLEAEARRGKLIKAGVVLAVVASGVFLGLHQLLAEAGDTVWYGATSLGPTPLPMRWLYPAGLGLTIAAVIGADTDVRQAALGMLLVLLAGFMPRSAPLMMLNLAGLALMARTAVTLRAAP